MDDENIFLFAGFLDEDYAFKGAIGVYDYFWALEPDTRQKLINSWKKTLDSLDETHIELAETFNIEEEYGSMAIFSDEDAVEVRTPPDNVVKFPK